MRFSADGIGGKNTSVDPNKIPDTDLQASTGTTPQTAVWSPEREDTLVYSPASAIRGMAVAGDPSSPSDTPEVVYFDDRSLYIDGADTTFDMPSDPVGTFYEALPIEGGYMFWGAADDGAGEDNPMVYRNGHLRQMGPWIWQNDLEPSSGTGIIKYTSTTTRAISAITAASPFVVTVAAGHGVAAGDAFSIVGSDALWANRGWVALASDATTITVDSDSTGLPAGTTGDTYDLAAGLVGDYKFYATCVVKFSDGKILESKPRGLYVGGPGGGITDGDPADAELITLAATDVISIGVSEYFNYSLANVYDISGTEGVDYFPGFRIYRTKNGGPDFYMIGEAYAGDAAIARFTSPGVFYYAYWSGGDVPEPLVLKDEELGALYDTDNNDRNTVPKVYDAAIAGQRIGIIDKDNRERFYFSSLDNLEYFHSLGFLTAPEKLHACESADGKWVLWGARRIWIVDITSGLPFMYEVNTSVGHVYPAAKARTELGPVVMRDDGLWAFNGAQFVKVSRKAYTAVDGTPNTVCKTDDLLIACSDDAGAGTADYPGVKLVYTDGGEFWHDVDQANGGGIVRGAFDGTIYRARPDGIWSCYTGSGYKNASATGKQFGNGETLRVKEIVFICEGDGDIAAYITSNVAGPFLIEEFEPDEAYGIAGGGRHKRWFYPPRMSGEYFTVSWETSGYVKIYGYWLEMERP